MILRAKTRNKEIWFQQDTIYLCMVHYEGNVKKHFFNCGQDLQLFPLNSITNFFQARYCLGSPKIFELFSQMRYGPTCKHYVSYKTKTKLVLKTYCRIIKSFTNVSEAGRSYSLFQKDNIKTAYHYITLGLIWIKRNVWQTTFIWSNESVFWADDHTHLLCVIVI